LINIYKGILLKNNMRILIVGAGVAGLSCARGLLLHNIKADVIDSAPKWMNIGYFLALWPNAWQVLDALQIYHLKQKSAHIKGFDAYDKNNKLLYKTDFTTMESRYGSVREIERDVLHRGLRESIPSEMIQLNTTVTAMKQNAHGVQVTLSDGTHKEYDIVIGADGINSKVRQLMFPTVNKRNNGYAMFMFWVPRFIDGGNWITSYLGPQKYIGLYPTKNYKHMGVFVTLPLSDKKLPSREEARTFIREHYKDIGGYVPELLHHLPRLPANYFENFDNEVYGKKWSNNRVILIGDAAHALSPMMSMGASMALEDGYVLSQEIEKSLLYTEAFARFEAIRHPRVKRLAQVSQALHALVIGHKWSSFGMNTLVKYAFIPTYFRTLESCAKGVTRL